VGGGVQAVSNVDTLSVACCAAMFPSVVCDGFFLLGASPCHQWV
jgi:hypothetical protein